MSPSPGRDSRLAATPYSLKPERNSSHGRLLELLPMRGAGLRVLDVGCAGGYLSSILRSRGFSVVAIEKPGIARELPDGVELIEADLDDSVPPVGGEFSYIVCGDVIEHLRDPIGALKQLRTLLAPGGVLLASVPNAANLYVRMNVLFGRFPEHDRGLFDRTHLHFCHYKRWVSIFERAGLRVEKVKSTPIPFGLAAPRMPRRLTGALEGVWGLLARVRKELFAYQFVLRARAAEEIEAEAPPPAVLIAGHAPDEPAQEPAAARVRAPAAASAPARVVVVMPAYNAAKTLGKTYADLPHDLVDLVIVVDDGSRDETARIAREMGLAVFVHNRNYGYGANQKTCYREALRAGAEIVVMVHPDYQYDPTLLPEIIRPIQEGRADIVLGSRLLGASPVKQGMPWWKYVSNRFLTHVENWTFGLKLSEYHTGYRAFHRDVLEALNITMNSDNFIFDQEIMAQAVDVNARIAEVPVPTRYHPLASSASFVQSSVYGMSILWLLFRYALHRSRILPQRQFESLAHRYRPELRRHSEHGSERGTGIR